MGETKKKTTHKTQKQPQGAKPSGKPAPEVQKHRFSDLDQYLFGQATHYEIFWKWAHIRIASTERQAPGLLCGRPTHRRFPWWAISITGRPMCTAWN